MLFEKWCAIAGILFLGMALIPRLLNRLPLTTSVIYLVAGFALGPLGWQLVRLNPIENGILLERLSEIVVLVSLFTSGLKLRLPLSDPKWGIPLRLALGALTVNVALIAVIGVYLLKLPLGAAILLGAILSPTDPVLASDVTVKHAHDDDILRFSLTGEASFNDGSAFPFVMLGLGLLGAHDLGDWGWKWVAVDVVWASVCGLSVGALLGFLVARLVIFLRQEHKEAVGTDDFLTLGLIAGAYGIALLLHGYGFLAVFAAGLAMRHTERHLSEAAGVGEDKAGNEACEAENEAENGAEENLENEEIKEKAAIHPETAPRHLVGEVLSFNEKLERIGELGFVVLLGGLIFGTTWTQTVWWLAPLLFLVVRPLSVWPFLGSRELSRARPLIAWFGIRGVGSLFYLFYAIEHGVPHELAPRLIALTFSVVALSILVHGLSVTPLMKFYEEKSES